ncbi:MAG: Cna B-type domain-containing protein [Atopobiaceae bacterium]|nr:Cna B-type domain-containing protein [Atopobiaceae bacterium]
MSVQTNQKPHRTKSVRQAINAVTSVVVSISMVLSLYGCGSTETLSLTATALSSRASAAMSAVSFLRQASEAGKENGTPDEKSKHEEKSTSAEQGNDEASKQEWPRKLAETVKVDDTDRFVTVKVEYGEDAGIPYDAKLKVERLDENDDRKNLLRGLLQVGEGDYVAGYAFAKAALVVDDKEVQPTKPIDVIVETNLIEWSQSDAIEMALLGNADVTTLNVENLTGKDDAGNETADPPYSCVKFSAPALGEMGFASVAAEKYVTDMNGVMISVLGPRTKSVAVDEQQRDDELESGQALQKVLTFSTDPAHSWSSTLWVRAVDGRSEGERRGYAIGRMMHEGQLADELFGRDGTTEPVRVSEWDQVGLVWASEEEPSAEGPSDGMVNEAEGESSAQENDNQKEQVETREEGQTEQDAATEVESSSDGQQVVNQHSDEKSGEQNGRQTPLDLVSHGIDTTESVRSGAEELREDTVKGRGFEQESVTLEAKSGTSKDGVDVQLSVEHAEAIPADVTLEVSELKGAEAAKYRVPSEATLGAETDYFRVFDISLVGPSGIEYEPTVPVKVAIKLNDDEVPEETEVLHFSDNMVATNVGAVQTDDAFEFVTDEFSVYVVSGTVDESTSGVAESDGNRPVFRLEVEDSVMLSEVLQELAYLYEDSVLSIDDVEDVSVSDTATGAASSLTVEEVTDESDSSTSRDWKLTVESPFESLTLNLSLRDSNTVAIDLKALIPVTIQADDETKVYDGYALSASGYSVSGLAEGDSIQSVTVEGTCTDVGTSTSRVEDAQIVNANGENVTATYEIKYMPGTLEVTKKPITITADNAEKVYDGTMLEKNTYTSTGLADGDVFDSVSVSGTQTLAGTTENVPSNARIVRPTEGSTVVDVNDNYDITYKNGTLKVTKRELNIIADSASKEYDGTALTKESYTTDGLAKGDSVENVTVAGSQTDAGTSENVPSAAKIVNSEQEDVTGCYNVTYTNGMLEVTKKNVKLTAASSVQVHDGALKTVDGFTVSADDAQLSGVKFGDSLSASGSGTAVGSYDVTFSNVTVGETTDASGNYVVGEVENGTLLVVEHAPLEKSLKSFKGNVASYQITINPNGLELNKGGKLTLRDTFSDNQSIDYVSIRVDNDQVTYDYSGFTGTYVVPDKTPVNITYSTRVAGAAGTDASFGNTARLGVSKDGGFDNWYSASVTETQTITPTGSDIEGTDGEYVIRLFAYAQNHMEEGLEGAVFQLLDANQRPITYRAGEQAGNAVTFETGSDGFVTVELNDGVVSLRKNTVYYLEMIEAPVSENGDGSYTYYQKDNTLFRFLITDDPSYEGNYNYFNGDVLKVRCYPEASGINVTKRFAGNYSPTDEQKNQIRFVLQKEDLARGKWVDVESHTYSELSYGSMNFKAGRAGGEPLEEAVPYRLIEENDEIEGVDHSRSVTLTYQNKGQTIQEYNNEFVVDPDSNTYSFSFVYENTYIDHKLTLVKMNERAGELLPGAEFTVYTASDNAEVKTYTTDEEGTLEIRRDDEGANYVADTAYYVTETNPPQGYLTPKSPEKVYFYFSESGSGVPEGLPSDVTAVDLTTTYDTVVINNQTDTVSVPVTVTWPSDEPNGWPTDVDSVTVALYQSVNGGDATPVLRDGRPLAITLSNAKTFDNTTFASLPARDGEGNDITYSVKQNELAEYYTSYKVSSSGWYVIKNEHAVSVIVKKEWYNLNNEPLSADQASGKGSVKFDLYRTTTESESAATRSELESMLRSATPVKKGIELSSDNDWQETIASLQKQNAKGDKYYYYALEREDAMPRNNEDSYGIAPASDSSPRTLTIKNTQTPTTVIIGAEDLEKAYGQDDPAFAFTTEVQDDDCTISAPVLGDDGRYVVTVKKGTEETQISFACTREEGEDVGTYPIVPEGDSSQGNYRVRFDNGDLTITPAQVTVRGTATKVYGDADPTLVEITGLKDGDSIAYYAYRDIGEHKGNYRITVTGQTKQGNYEITYVNGYLTIEPAPVTVKADDISRAYGEEDPALTVTMDGLKNQDAQSVIKYHIERAEGESVGEYPITVTGDGSQGNYTVTFEPGTFTITGHKVTVRAKNFAKTYGDDDPTWEAEVTGLKEGDTLDYSFSRAPGEDAGTYVITPAGEATQGNYSITYETGLLTINRAPLTVTPVDVVKPLTNPVTADPQLSVTFDKLRNGDDEIVPTAEYDSGTRTWTYTYAREGSANPEFSFTLTRTPGEAAGPHVIAASAHGERAKNYNTTYKTGTFTILATHNVTVNQKTLDLVDTTNNPEYTYIASLDLTGTGIEDYDVGGFENNQITFTLPNEGVSSKVLPIPSGAKLTITQETRNPDYTTTVAATDGTVSGTTVQIDSVDKASTINVTHTRISLPVQARAALRQTESGSADEEGAIEVEPLGYLGIARDSERNPIAQSADDLKGELDAQGIYNLPEDKYYVPDHLSVYNEESVVAANVQAVRYDADSGAWQYSTDGVGYTSFNDGERLKLFYKPKFICRVQADGQSFYTLKDALSHIGEIANDKKGTIEMLIESYTMPASDALTVPANYDITLTTANELGGDSVILRKRSFSAGHMITNGGKLTLGSIALDGNKNRVSANEAMLLNKGALTVGGGTVLQNASGVNGGALYVDGGSVEVQAGASFSGNKATNGGAIYFRDGSISIATTNITQNEAANGGAIYIGATQNNTHTLTLTTASILTQNTATNGGAVYMAGGKVESGGAIADNSATNGGAVFVTNGTLHVADGSVNGNTATHGGALYMSGGILNMTGGSATNNTASEDGGMLYASNATVKVEGGVITGNVATTGNGGAILLASGTATVGGATIQNNAAANGNGGAICQEGGTLTATGTIDGENTAENGSAVYVQTGRATFDGCTITGNAATAGGAIGVGSEEARLFFAGDVQVKDNTWGDKTGNLYLDKDTDLVINTNGLGENADIGVHVSDEFLDTRGDVGCKFGTYTANANLSRFHNDVNPTLTASDNNYKIIWSQSIKVQVLRLSSYASAFPPAGSAASLASFSYAPKSQENDIYDLVMEMYDKFKTKITGDDLYAYSFASTARDFAQFLSAINWNSANQCWDFVERGGATATGSNPTLKIYYSEGAYLSIVNNSAYDLTVDSMKVLNTDVPVYGYPTVKNNVTQSSFVPVTSKDLVLKSGENIKLLFPGAVNQNWTLTGTFTNPATGEAVGNADYAYTLDRTHGGTEQTATTDANGSLTHSGKTNGTAGGSYEILFGDPTHICKVTDSAGEHPFATLNAAWNYIVDNDLTYTMEDGTTRLGGTIEMLVDYLQPLNDVLNINEASFTSRGKEYSGYCLRLTTAATEGVQYPYVGKPGATRATISRDSDNGGAAVIAMPHKNEVRTETQCDAYLITENLSFDGKALAKKGNGGAISTANNVVTIKGCDFKGYQAQRGGAIFVAWGGLTVGGDETKDHCTFSNCTTGDKEDKTGGGAIWSTAQNIIVKNSDFDHCACESGLSQGGGIFHNIRKDGSVVYKDSEFPAFPTGYSANSSTQIIDCNFNDCYAEGGSGGTVESDSMQVTVKGCTFKGSYSNKNNANGGALNILHNDAWQSADVYQNSKLEVIGSTFENCQTQKDNSSGGAICDQNSFEVTITNCDFINCRGYYGGAVRINQNSVPNVTVNALGSRFENCNAGNSGGAMNANAKTMTIRDSYQAEDGTTITKNAYVKDCTAPNYGGIYQIGDVEGSEVAVQNVYFDNCKSITGNGGALYVNARSLSITGTPRVSENDAYTFKDCTAGSSGGGVYHCPKSTPPDSKDELEDVSFYNCSASAQGGGARLIVATISMSDAEVRACEAVAAGGGIYMQGKSTVTDCVFDGNSATGETGQGGSLYISSGAVGITGGTISKSIAVNGGGIYNRGTLTINKGSGTSDAITSCAARTSGGGIYTTNAVTLDETTISDCYAVTSGGGIYQGGGDLLPYGTITGCYAGQGGGVYSNTYIDMKDATKAATISDCHAASVVIAEDGSASADAELQPSNLGGGIYKAGAGNWDLKSSGVTISGCSAYDGGGVYYNTTGKLTYTAGNLYANKATNNGGAIYKNLGNINMTGGIIGGSKENANMAQLGAGIFVADGQNTTIGGGRITHNVAEVGGAVAVGGNNANTQLLFQGAPVVKDNTKASGEKCNVYLNYDSNGIIRTSGTALAPGASIGVYVNDEQFAKHGDYGTPFGTYNKTNNLGSFINDRIYAGGLKGAGNNSQIVWGRYVCKITDASGNLLYTDATCEAPAVYTMLENNGSTDATSAFGALNNATPKLYNADGQYSGAYQIQMLVEDYGCTKQMKLTNGTKDITITTASKTPDECGFYYTGDAEYATIRRAATYNSMIDAAKMSSLTIENITIDGGSKEGWKSTAAGGIIFVAEGTQVHLNQNATLCNSDAQGYYGAGIRMQDSNANQLYINGAVIRNCVTTQYGGGISNKTGNIIMTDGLITECSAAYGGAVIVEGRMDMSGGTITANEAKAEGAGIDLRAASSSIHFSGNPVVTGNTMKGAACNVQLTQDKNGLIYAEGLDADAEIGIYTTGTIYNKHGKTGDKFGTWSNVANLHCFINDVTPTLRGYRNSTNAGDNLICWYIKSVLDVSKQVDSDWAADKTHSFNLEVKLHALVDNLPDFEPITFGDMTFNYDGDDPSTLVAIVPITSGQTKSTSGMPYEYLHNVEYTVTELFPESGNPYDTTNKKNEVSSTGVTVSGTLGENMSDDPLASSSVSKVEFTNERKKDDLTISKKVDEGTTGDNAIPFAFTLTLDDHTITKTYDADRFQDSDESEGTATSITFTDGVAHFALTHGQSIKIKDLPKELGFTVHEEQGAEFRAYVTEDAEAEINNSSSTGTIGELHHVSFRNVRIGLVCKIVNGDLGREQLFYREGNNPLAEPIPAIFEELEAAFETISAGTHFFTASGESAEPKLRVEMVRSHYTMNRPAVLAGGYNVTLGTALKTDQLYPYPTDAESPAVVRRGFDGESMFVANGTLSIDNIVLDGASVPDGGSDAYVASSEGGIVRASGSNKLTVTSNAVLRNSITEGKNGGAIWVGENAGLEMNGKITNCEALQGGGVYAADGFGGTVVGGITIGGIISGCKATAGNGGALYAGTFGGDDTLVTPIALTGSAQLTGDSAVGTDEDSGRGGAIYASADLAIDGTSVLVGNNTAANDGGGIYMGSDTTFTMSGGSISGNTASSGNGGGIWVQGETSITDGVFTGNKATTGKGGAIYAAPSADVTIAGENAALANNEAAQGGAVFAKGEVTVANGAITGNTASDAGGAVYVANDSSFTMSGGSISGNKSQQGAVSTGNAATLTFSGDASVTDNTAADGTKAMNVYLGYDTNAIINAHDLTGSSPIGVYVANGDDKAIYYNHGIAGRTFGTSGTANEKNLNKFVNDKDSGLKGVQGPNNRIMWPGKSLVIQVYQNKEDQQGEKTHPVGGAKFSLTNENGVKVWSGESNASTGVFSVPWGITESENGGAATFLREENGSVTSVTYVLAQEEANQDTVRPAGTWKLTVDKDNTVTWEAVPSVDDGGNQVESVNRIVNVVAPSAPAILGNTFLLYNDVKPTITFDANGGILADGSSSTRTDGIDFSSTEVSHTYTINESNPTHDDFAFRAWSTVKNPTEGDGHKEYRQGDEMLFYRHSDDDDVTLYALWSPVVCKITDRNDNLLYVNGSPAVYTSLKAGFDAFNEAVFTLNGVKTTPRKIKMLVGEYEMTESVELARGKIAEFTTASPKDTDGYHGPNNACVIKRAASFDSGSMIVDNYTLVLRNITLDGAVKDASGNAKTIDGNGGIVTVVGNAAHLTLAQDTVLQNASVSGNGGAIYAYGSTSVAVSEGSKIVGCQAANGGAIYADRKMGAMSSQEADSTVSIEGGEIINNAATEGNGGGVYAAGAVNMSDGIVDNNSAETAGGGLYLESGVDFSMTGGSIKGNTATMSGGGVYVGDGGSFALTAGSIGGTESPNTAHFGSGVYLAGSAQLAGGSISYNGTEGVGDGGGIYIVSASNVALNGVELSHNRAQNGGGIYAANAPNEKETMLTLAGGSVSDNTASGNGGGIYLAERITLSMAEGTLGEGNEADLGGGAYVAGTFEFTGGSLRGNAAHGGAGAYVAKGGTMTVAGGSINGNQASKNEGGTEGNGAAVYVAGDETAHGTLNVTAGAISENVAAGSGGAVYLQDYAQMSVSDTTISGNSASAVNGGAINAEGENARIYLSGSPSIFNNPGNAATTSQKNLVLSSDTTNIINTTGEGLTGGTVGVYVIDGDSLYDKHGVYNTPFGTFGEADTNREYAKYLVNDRNLALYGVTKGDDDDSIYWLDVVCKVTNDADLMLYKRVEVNGTSISVHVPAVFSGVEEGIEAVSGQLYRKSGSRYAAANSGAVKVKMLKDYTLGDQEIIAYEANRGLTLTTAETSVSSAMQSNGDSYVYTSASDAEGERLTKATLARGEGDGSMFTVNTPSNAFNVSNLIIDGDNNTMTTAGENGGAFNIVAVKTSVFDGVVLSNLNATDSGGAIYLASGALTLKDSRIEDCVAVKGGGVYVAGGAVSIAGFTTIRNNTATENGDGAGIYVVEGATLSLSSSPNFGGADMTNGNHKEGALDNATNGQMDYAMARQDIFLAGYEGGDAKSLVIAGPLDVEAGSIWVWAEQSKHYEMLDQFAVFANGVRNKMSAEALSKTFAAFRNAQVDTLTGCGGDYLTGQSGEGIKNLYWTGGFDFAFLKTDGNGDALNGATFTLFQADAEGTGILKDGQGKEVAYQQVVDGSKQSATATSKTVTKTNATKIKVKKGDSVVEKSVYGDGIVAFEKIPPATYFLKETVFPKVPNSDETYTFVYETYKLVLNGDGTYDIYTDAAGKMKAGTKEINTGDDAVTIYTVMNVPQEGRKVILRKVSVRKVSEDDDEYEYSSLAGATIRIYREDWTPYDDEDHKSVNPSGAFFVETLPYGTYHLVETEFPKGYDPNDDKTWYYYTLTVGQEGDKFNNSKGEEITLDVRGTYVEGPFKISLSSEGPYTVGQGDVTATLNRAAAGEAFAPYTDGVTWESSSDVVFTVDGNGALTFKGAGTATLTAYVNDESVATASIAVR